MRRLAIALVVALHVVALPHIAAAQLTSLAKKIKAKASGESPALATTTGTPTGKVTVLVTPNVVDRFITGFRAERAERDRLEAEHSSDGVGKLYAARDLVPRCDSMKRADSAYQISTLRKMQAGDQQAMKDFQKWVQSQPQEPMHLKCRDNRAPHESDQSFFTMMASVQARQDTVGAKAGGFAVPEYGVAREKIAAYVLWSNVFPGREVHGYTPDESAAIAAKKGVLLELLDRDYNISGDPKNTGQL